MFMSPLKTNLFLHINLNNHEIKAIQRAFSCRRTNIQTKPNGKPKTVTENMRFFPNSSTFVQLFYHYLCKKFRSIVCKHCKVFILSLKINAFGNVLHTAITQNLMLCAAANILDQVCLCSCYSFLFLLYLCVMFASFRFVRLFVRSVVFHVCFSSSFTKFVANVNERAWYAYVKAVCHIVRRLV